MFLSLFYRSMGSYFLIHMQYQFLHSDFVFCMNFFLSAILFDFSKAFDKVPHQSLASKLEHYGVQGLWNSLPAEVITAPTLKIFKTHSHRPEKYFYPVFNLHRGTSVPSHMYIVTLCMRMFQRNPAHYWKIVSSERKAYDVFFLLIIII